MRQLLIIVKYTDQLQGTIHHGTVLLTCKAAKLFWSWTKVCGVNCSHVSTPLVDELSSCSAGWALSSLTSSVLSCWSDIILLCSSVRASNLAASASLSACTCLSNYRKGQWTYMYSMCWDKTLTHNRTNFIVWVTQIVLHIFHFKNVVIVLLEYSKKCT